MRVVLYLRYSSNKQTEQSIEGQDHICTEWAVRNGHTIVDRYIDRATSATTTAKRTAFLKMINDANKHLFDAVVVYKLDRFARNRYDSALYKHKLKLCNVQLFSAMENISDTPESVILESVLEGFAEYYSKDLSQKVTRGMYETAHKHKYTGGVVPLGYKIVDNEFVIDEKTAELVRYIFRQVADGESQANVIQYLNANGYKTSTGAAWGKSSFRKLLRNKKYIGYYTYGEYSCEDAIPSIIDKSTFERVQHIMSNHAHITKAKVPYLLSGKVFYKGCQLWGNCGRNAQGRTYYYYMTKSDAEHKISFPKDMLEDVVVKDTLSVIGDDVIDTIAKAVEERTRNSSEDKEIEMLTAQRETLQGKYDTLLDMVTPKNKDLIQKKMDEVEEQISNIDEEIANLKINRIPYIPESVVKDYFKQLKNEKVYKALLDYFLVRIDIDKADGDEYTVNYQYRFLGESLGIRTVGFTIVRRAKLFGKFVRVYLSLLKVCVCLKHRLK